ncbi:hypothetical protein CTI12_AA371880 [Artemisia annua]|uniref:Uncharacterized protein n=1 Tax=Artemisia annua TaxID=35608 RepID=A0A2U1M599_ARTAN|nr:hypothetical protein CTI12_AA371880 [Artemisia annua]
MRAGVGRFYLGFRCIGIVCKDETKAVVLSVFACINEGNDINHAYDCFCQAATSVPNTKEGSQNEMKMVC